MNKKTRQTTKKDEAGQVLGTLATHGTPVMATAPDDENIVIPSIKWSNDQLGEFASKLGKKTAVDVWRMGRAIMYAHGRLKHGEWGVWQKKYLPFLCPKTISRYEAVGGLLYDDVKDVNLDTVYKQLFGEDYAVKKPAAPPAPPPAQPPGDQNVKPTAPPPPPPLVDQFVGPPAPPSVQLAQQQKEWSEMVDADALRDEWEDDKDFWFENRLGYAIDIMNRAIADDDDDDIDELDIDANYDDLVKLADRLRDFLATYRPAV